VNPNTGELVVGLQTLPEGELAAARVDMAAQIRARKLDDDWYRERTAVLENITVPVLSAANWAASVRGLIGLTFRLGCEGLSYRARAGPSAAWARGL
jgi:hypothetical protein